MKLATLTNIARELLAVVFVAAVFAAILAVDTVRLDRIFTEWIK
jgi:hypothetical protein